MTKQGSNDFASQLAAYQARIDPLLKQYAQDLLDQTHKDYGSHPAEVVKAYTDVLLRGGKRLRGSLAICAYEMFGGSDKRLINQAAVGLEMLNTYILLADDIQDRSKLRRGGPTAHVLLSDYHKKHKLKGDSEHFGQSLAINSFLFGLHAAMNVFANLPTTAHPKIKVIKLINDSFMTTAHGQTLDMVSEVNSQTSFKDIDNVLVWKTAYYTFINPLQLGAILAGAKAKDLQVLKTFGLHAGRVFQIADDINGIFGTEKVLGKSPMDDIKEGKRNLLTLKALELAPKQDAIFLNSMLGNQNLTTAEFKKCQEIIYNSGALQYVGEVVKSQADLAHEIVKVQKSWQLPSKTFLMSLTTHIAEITQTFDNNHKRRL